MLHDSLAGRCFCKPQLTGSTAFYYEVPYRNRTRTLEFLVSSYYVVTMEKNCVVAASRMAKLSINTFVAEAAGRHSCYTVLVVKTGGRWTVRPSVLCVLNHRRPLTTWHSIKKFASSSLSVVYFFEMIIWSYGKEKYYRIHTWLHWKNEKSNMPCRMDWQIRRDLHLQ